MAASHNSPPKPSPLLALICLAIVHRLRPDWTAVPLQAAAADCGISAQRLSRLTSRALSSLETVVSQLTRRGRPRLDRAANKAADEAKVTGALLEVATSLLQCLPLRGDQVRALLVGAYLRLCVTKRLLSQKRFCAAMGLPARTLRQWLATASTAPKAVSVAPPQPKRRRNRRLRRPRFGFDVTLPDTQLAADTTDLRAFDVPLKLVAAQDVGGRDTDLLDSVIIDDHECADHVATVIAEAVGDKLGQQVINDQGTPYGPADWTPTYPRRRHQRSVTREPLRPVFCPRRVAGGAAKEAAVAVEISSASSVRVLVLDGAELFRFCCGAATLRPARATSSLSKTFFWWPARCRSRRSRARGPPASTARCRRRRPRTVATRNLNSETK